MSEGVGIAIGHRIRGLREQAGWTQDRLARAVSLHGVSWTQARVRQVEAGNITPDLTVLIAVARALAAFHGPLPVSVLLPDGDLTDAVSGKPMTPPRLVNARPVTESLDWTRADDKAAVDLGLDADHFAMLTDYVYGHTASVERDERAGADATPQKRGRVMRGVIEELREALPRWEQHRADTEM
ncbi:HTH cro/C1-type domain-containing protein [Tsukamurella ocularis]|uniref:helix-turn-helix domain-containing protein n=1 Tax=Tsukamurella ocularis TaxID=1970234 RepID=UPI0039F08A64